MKLRPTDTESLTRTEPVPVPSLDGQCLGVQYCSTNNERYDVLIVAMPQLNFSASEVTAVTSWVNQGGLFFAIGDFAPGDADTSTRINYLLSNLELRIYSTYNDENNIASPTSHVTTEGCSSMSYGWPKGYVNISGSAVIGLLVVVNLIRLRNRSSLSV